jgi:hypothetical protein
MLCHAVELALRAYLVSRGVADASLRRRGLMHNLKPLMIKALGAGLPLDVPTSIKITQLDEAHREYWHRYPRAEAKPVFVIDPFV